MGVQVPPGAPIINSFMQNRFHRKLSLPVSLIPFDYNITDESILFKEIQMSNDHINSEVLDFFLSLGLEIITPRYFYSKPPHAYKLHIDVPIPNNQIIRLNWIFGGAGSNMIWYDLKPGCSTQIIRNSQDERIFSISNNDCIEVARANLTGPNLVNVGIIHNLIPGTEARHCYSFFLRNKKFRPFENKNALIRNRLEWDEALSRFGDYIV